MTDSIEKLPVLLTSWDDGSETDLRLAELLARYGFRGTYFATARPPSTSPASDSDLHAIVELGHEIGNHGVSHRSFTRLSEVEILDEARRGAQRAREFSQGVADVIAPPNGRVDRRVVRVLTADGYCIRTAPIVACRTPRKGTLEPTCQLYPHGRVRTLLHVAKRRSLSDPTVAVSWLLSGSVFDRIGRLIEVFGRRGVPLHVWGHSEEVERLRYWDKIERLLDLARERGYTGMTLSAYLKRFDSDQQPSVS